MRNEFLCRARGYAFELEQSRLALTRSDRDDELDHIRQIAHRLAGGAGIYGFQMISADAQTLEEALRTEMADVVIQSAITTLVNSISVSAIH